jgi:FkbM family methyltransferase
MLPEYLTAERGVLEATARQQCQVARIGDRTLLCRVLGKYIFYADPDDVGITPHLCLNGYWESWITIAMARILKPGWRCIDVGANQGYYTMLMADAVGTGGRVVAVEPNPRLAELIGLSLEVNGFLQRAEVVRKAVSDRTSDRNGCAMFLNVPRRRAMNANISHNRNDAMDAIEVETVTLDHVVTDWPRIDLVKIDAEGAEESIWRGMRRTIDRNPGITVVMEVNCARYAEPRAFLREIEGAGFPLRHIDYDGTVSETTEEQIIARSGGEDWMLFLRRGQL